MSLLLFIITMWYIDASYLPLLKAGSRDWEGERGPEEATYGPHVARFARIQDSR